MLPLIKILRMSLIRERFLKRIYEYFHRVTDRVWTNMCLLKASCVSWLTAQRDVICWTRQDKQYLSPPNTNSEWNPTSVYQLGLAPIACVGLPT